MASATDYSSKSTTEDVPIGNLGGKATIRSAGNEDQPASLNQDKLGFAPYVEAVLSFLKHPATRPPFTLSIEGEWGSGKSSFMLQLQQSLKKNGHRTVGFNAWRHDKMESMWAAFALHFIRELSASLPWWARVRANLRLVWMRFNFLRAWPTLFVSAVLIAFYFLLIGKLWHVGLNLDLLFSTNGGINWKEAIKALGWVGSITALLFFLKKASEVTGNPLQVDLQKFTKTPRYSGYASFIEDFHYDFRRSVDVLAGNQEKIFVFIDDLDRADVPKAAELMQGLNLMITDAPKLIFIVGMNREKVAAGVAAKYKDLLKFLNPSHASLDTADGLRQARAFGYDFLEKFIQLSFKIPQPSIHTLEDFVRSLSQSEPVENAIGSEIRYNPVLTVEDGKDSADFQEVIRLVAPFFDYNPRRIKQFVNTFRLKAHIAHSTGLFGLSDGLTYSNLTIPQLGKFVAICQKWPDIVDDLALQPDLFRVILSGDIEHVPATWSANDSFVKLLRLAPDWANYSDYAMENVNVVKLLETSPAVVLANTEQQSALRSNGNASSTRRTTRTEPRPIPATENSTTTKATRSTARETVAASRPPASRRNTPTSKRAAK